MPDPEDWYKKRAQALFRAHLITEIYITMQKANFINQCMFRNQSGMILITVKIRLINKIKSIAYFTYNK